MLKLCNFVGHSNDKFYLEMRMKTIYVLVGIILIAGACHSRNKANDSDVFEYYQDGSVKSQTPVKNGKRNGLVRNFNENGKLLSTAEYVEDLREGWLINYSTENYKPMLKAYFKKDTQNGPVIQYYQEGMLFRESNYVKGRLDGLVKTYWPNGKLKAENFYQMGKPAIGLKEYKSDGITPVLEPSIQIRQKIQTGLHNKVMLDISLTSEVDEVEFYTGNLEDGKFLNLHSQALRCEDGVATLEYTVSAAREFKVISILAKAKTRMGSTLILQKSHTF
jgi:antitoxin component YwqK of YwqJK toxin-antitoxin module